MATARVGHVATVVDAGDPLDLHRVLADLHGRGVARLMVEGGAQVHGLVLAAGVVDELQLVVAPLVVGDPGAPRFGGTAARQLGLRCPGRRMATSSCEPTDGRR